MFGVRIIVASGLWGGDFGYTCSLGLIKLDTVYSLPLLSFILLTPFAQFLKS